MTRVYAEGGSPRVSDRYFITLAKNVCKCLLRVGCTTIHFPRNRDAFMYWDAGTDEGCADVFEHLRRDGMTVSYHLCGWLKGDGARWTHVCG